MMQDELVLQGHILDDESPLFEQLQDCRLSEAEAVDLVNSKFPGYERDVVLRVIDSIREFL